MFKSMTVRAAIVAILAGLSLSAHAIADSPKTVDIPAGDLRQALLKVSEQFSADLVFSTEQVQGLKTFGAHGELTTEQAITKLLEGTPLELRTDPSGAMLIARPGASSAVPQTSAEHTQAKSFWSRLRLAQVDQSSPSQGEGQGEVDQQTAENQQNGEQAQSQKKTELEEVITVTGTRIRGAPPASQVIRLSGEDLRLLGNSNLGEAIRQLPQNFSGGSNPTIGAISGEGGAANANPNSSSQINLRGLGKDASLTLLNGRRLAYNGAGQGIDISAIPLDAIDRLEVVADGSSALYGSDAVGGVANVILKRQYDGISTSARFGAATEGGAELQQYGLVGGRSWNGGGLVATLNYEDSASITARQRSYTSAQHPEHTIYPSIEHWGGVISAHHALSESVTFNLDALYSDRSSFVAFSNAADAYTTNGRGTNTGNTSFTVTPNLDFRLPGGWVGNVSLVWGQDDTRMNHRYWTGGALNRTRTGKQDNTIGVYELTAEGPVADLPGGDVRLAVGAGRRRNTLKTTYQDFLLSGPAAPEMEDARQTSQYAFGELFVPVLGDKLSITAAARYEDYEEMGDIVVPRIGLVYAPNDSIDLKLSWGKSFKAPVLAIQHLDVGSYLYPANWFVSGYPAAATILHDTGGNRDLKPEKADSASITVGFHPQSLPGLDAQLSYFRVRYKERVVTPIASISSALSNPIYASYVTLNPTAAQQAAVIADSEIGLESYASDPYDPTNVIALIHARYTNAQSQDIEGIDLQASYGFNLRNGSELTPHLAASYLSSDQTLIAGQPSTPMAGSIFNPSHVRATAGLSWRMGDFTLAPHALYTGSLTDNRRPSPVRLDDQITFNLTAGYNIPTAPLPGIRDLTLSVSVLNLTDTPPEPIATSVPYEAPYESTNYSPVGRFVHISLTGRWL